jgi:hypothetical protein
LRSESETLSNSEIVHESEDEEMQVVILVDKADSDEDITHLAAPGQGTSTDTSELILEIEDAKKIT